MPAAGNPVGRIGRSHILTQSNVRKVRTGDKVRVLQQRSFLKTGDLRLWLVKLIRKVDGDKIAEIVPSDATYTEVKAQAIPLNDLVVIAEVRDVIYSGLDIAATAAAPNLPTQHASVSW